MIAYVTLGTNNLARATSFYDEILGKMGATKSLEAERMTAWEFGEGKPRFTVTLPFDENDATAGNGVMIALSAANKDAVDKLHAKVIELGGTSEGGPYLKGNKFYVGYFRDLDGNKLNVHCYV